MPARRRSYRGEQKRKPSLKLVTYLFFVIIIIASIIYINNSRKFWDGENKLPLAIRGDSGDINLVVFDPAVSEIININIAGNTQVEVAQQKGVYKIKNVWELGGNERQGGALLARTITKHLKLPVFAWANSQALGFIEPNPKSLFRAIFFSYENNLSLGDRVGIGFFVLRVKNPDKVDINLSETSYLKKTTLLDGDVGYVISGNLPQKLSALFANESFLEKTVRVRILDATGKMGIAEEVADVVEVLGAKVSSIEKEKEKDIICQVKGDKMQVEIITMLLPCEKERSDGVSNFDLEIELGKEFINRY